MNEMCSMQQSKHVHWRIMDTLSFIRTIITPTKLCQQVSIKLFMHAIFQAIKKRQAELDDKLKQPSTVTKYTPSNCYLLKFQIHHIISK